MTNTMKSVVSHRASCSSSVLVAQDCSTGAKRVAKRTPFTHQGRSRVSVRSGKLEDIPLFADSSLLGGVSSNTILGSSAGAGAKPKDVKDVPLTSDAGMDYTALRDALSAGDFRQADDETRALLIKLAGDGAVKRGWVYYTEVKTMPDSDLQTLDALWKTASSGKFGYSVQKEVWIQNQRRWPKFFKQIDWTVGENNNYRKWPAEFMYSVDAPKGHLPLTNALRGTQLFQAIMEHPAFQNSAANKIDDSPIKSSQFGSVSWPAL